MRNPPLGCLLLASALVLPCASVTHAAANTETLARGDAAWARRAEGQNAGRAAAAPIAEAVAAYEEALSLEPASLETRARLLRARGRDADPERLEAVVDGDRRRALLDDVLREVL